jgi:thiol-disulfide isomerase/thioredoxin
MAALLASLALPTSGLAGEESTALKGKDGEPQGIIPEGSEPVPFALQDLDGETVELEDYRGKQAVLLAFWSFFCGPCREELPLLDQMGKKYADQGFEVLAINLDGSKLEKAVEKYMDSNNFTFRVLWEEIEGVSYKTADAYGVAGTPSLVLIGRNGKVNWAHVGREEGPEIDRHIRKAMELE